MTAETYSVSTIHVGDNADPAPHLGREGGVYMFVDCHDNGRQTLMWSNAAAFVAWADAVAEGAAELERIAARQRRLDLSEQADEARYDAESGVGAAPRIIREHVVTFTVTDEALNDLTQQGGGAA